MHAFAFAVPLMSLPGSSMQKVEARVTALETALQRRDERITELEGRLATLLAAADARSGGAGMASTTAAPAPAGSSTGLILAKPTLEVASFSSALLDQAFHVQVIFLEGSLVVWIGLAATPPSMQNMCLAMGTRFDTEAVTKNVLGDSDEAQAMAQRLSMRTGKQVFVSCDLQPAMEDVGQLVAFAERKLCAWLDERGQGGRGE